jgi:hypothetical protein
LGSQRSLARTAAAAATKALGAKAHQDRDGAQMIALQTSHGLANACGLCALKNVTVDDSFTLDRRLFHPHRGGLEEMLPDEAVRLGAAHEVYHVDADILRTRTRDGRGHLTYADTAHRWTRRRRGRGHSADAETLQTRTRSGRRRGRRRGADADTPRMRMPCGEDSTKSWTFRIVLALVGLKMLACVSGCEPWSSSRNEISTFAYRSTASHTRMKPSSSSFFATACKATASSGLLVCDDDFKHRDSAGGLLASRSPIRCVYMASLWPYTEVITADNLTEEAAA